MAETTIINIKAFKGSYKYIGRNTIFGNPFIIGEDGTRKEVIEKYKVYFKAKLKDPEFKKQVLKLRGHTLGCHCKPLLCHGDVITNYLNKKRR